MAYGHHTSGFQIWKIKIKNRKINTDYIAIKFLVVIYSMY